MEQADFSAIGDLFSKNKDKVKKGGLSQQKKPPAHEWQDLALRIIKELNVPNFKRNSVFRVCKENPRQFVKTCFSDTKELCKTGSKWSYFFKLVSVINKEEDSKE